MSDSADCPFCAIERGDAPASVVREDEESLAFLDVRPATSGHTLVVPREHSSGLADLPEATGGHLFRVAMRVAGALRAAERVRTDGVNVFLADGAAAGQDVFHVHLHVIPRTEDDGVTFAADRTVPDRAELDDLAGALAGRL